MEYNELLEQAYSQVKKVESKDRFEIPKAKSHIEGNKTIFSNLTEISKILRRKPDHLARFLIKELAAPGKVSGERLILNRKIGNSRINEKIPIYVKEFVICKECGKPDTELEKKDRVMFIHCLACGAKHPVRGKV